MRREMRQWTPEVLFACTYICSAITGLGVLLSGEKPVTMRLVCACFLVNGALGAGLGMAGYEYMGGKDAPWRVIGCGMLVGARAIKIAWIMNIARRVLSIPDEEKP